jgi:hypothetical protein
MARGFAALFHVVQAEISGMRHWELAIWCFIICPLSCCFGLIAQYLIHYNRGENMDRWRLYAWIAFRQFLNTWFIAVIYHLWSYNHARLAQSQEDYSELAAPVVVVEKPKP